ncbi:MAG: aminopeptidase [Clostridia bacterium]|nr:aminopeptidase [Clostridia bacterium]
MDLGYKNKNGWADADHSAVFDFAEGYKEFLNSGKSEREIVKEALRIAKNEGFVDITEKDELLPGDKIYSVNRNKGLMLAVMGKEPLRKGFNLVGAHVDSPRLDLKPNPLLEESGQALMKTHYYGGIKKYQWTTIPLMLTGVVIKKDGTKIDVSVGKDTDDFCFTISDILPHLAGDQMGRNLGNAIGGEDLTVLVGGIPLVEGDSQSVKKAILTILHDDYNIDEEEFLTAELEFTPAFPAKDVGFDKSFVGAYAQDDRVCAYAALQAILDINSPDKTAICLLVDKEEVGSMGVTGMKSKYFENMIADMIDMSDEYSELFVRHAFSNATCLSADVCAAFDPNFPSPFEKQNTPYAGCGISFMKYTGSRGKGGSSDATAELFASIVKIMDDNKICWQTGELGKVDGGGGGTIAQYTANLNMDTIDAGVPVLSMHSPFEVVSKLDLYESYRAYRAFYQSNSK